MYASNVKEKKLTFVVSGMLWNRSLVMKDLETESLWSHILGQSMAGELKDTQLKSIPSVMTDWKSWYREHPKTTALSMSRSSKNYLIEFYRKPSDFLVGMVEQDKVRSWGFEQLTLSPIVNDTIAKKSVVIFFDAKSGSAVIYNRKLGEKLLSFEKRGDKVVDRETGSSWNLYKGIATSGPLKDKRLTPEIGITSYTKTWDKFHPQSSTWTAN